eukprot:COSAG06_NODE_43685_length_369_cov_20.748148_1_plen_69_part_10
MPMAPELPSLRILAPKLHFLVIPGQKCHPTRLTSRPNVEPHWRPWFQGRGQNDAQQQKAVRFGFLDQRR